MIKHSLCCRKLIHLWGLELVINPVVNHLQLNNQSTHHHLVSPMFWTQRWFHHQLSCILETSWAVPVVSISATGNWWFLIEMFSYQCWRMIGFDYSGMDTRVILIYHALDSLLNHACTHTQTHARIINVAVQVLSLPGMTTGCISTTGYCSAGKHNYAQATYSGQKWEVCSWSQCLQAYISASQCAKRIFLTTSTAIEIDMVSPQNNTHTHVGIHTMELFRS